ncbi:MAG: hypothetical protein OEY59_07520 [Deltaproteobacteria bacterium]|nr:hypothetical protein [Deltaproteobacteria bacterium]
MVTGVFRIDNFLLYQLKNYEGNKNGKNVTQAPARVGNVMGGGDVASGRLGPDMVNSYLRVKQAHYIL